MECVKAKTVVQFQVAKWKKLLSLWAYMCRRTQFQLGQTGYLFLHDKDTTKGTKVVGDFLRFLSTDKSWIYHVPGLTPEQRSALFHGQYYVIDEGILRIVWHDFSLEGT